MPTDDIWVDVLGVRTEQTRRQPKVSTTTFHHQRADQVFPLLAVFPH